MDNHPVTAYRGGKFEEAAFASVFAMHHMFVASGLGQTGMILGLVRRTSMKRSVSRFQQEAAVGSTWIGFGTCR